MCLACPYSCHVRVPNTTAVVVPRPALKANDTPPSIPGIYPISLVFVFFLPYYREVVLFFILLGCVHWFGFLGGMRCRRFQLRVVKHTGMFQHFVRACYVRTLTSDLIFPVHFFLADVRLSFSFFFFFLTLLLSAFGHAVVTGVVPSSPVFAFNFYRA